MTEIATALIARATSFTTTIKTQNLSAIRRDTMMTASASTTLNNILFIRSKKITKEVAFSQKFHSNLTVRTETHNLPPPAHPLALSKPTLKLVIAIRKKVPNTVLLIHPKSSRSSKVTQSRIAQMTLTPFLAPSNKRQKSYRIRLSLPEQNLQESTETLRHRQIIELCICSNNKRRIMMYLDF